MSNIGDGRVIKKFRFWGTTQKFKFQTLCQILGREVWVKDKIVNFDDMGSFYQWYFTDENFKLPHSPHKVLHIDNNKREWDVLVLDERATH